MVQPALVNETAWILIMLISQTGAGKGRFINVAANKSIAPVNDNLTSTNLAVEAYTVRSASGCPVILVDTPGFDHVTESDSQILGRIIEWLKSCNLDVSFGGIIYLHDIAQDRVMTRWPGVYFSSPVTASHLLLTTTKSDRLSSENDYSCRENELRDGVWRGVVNGGARICRFQNTKESAWEVIDTLLALQPLKLSEFHEELDRLRGVGVVATPPGGKKGFLSKILSCCPGRK